MTDDAGAFDPGYPALAAVTGVVLLMSQDFTEATVATLRHALHAEVTAVGLTGDAGYDFVLAVHELVTNAVRHGGGRGHLELRRQDDVLTCEIIDQGPAPGHLPVRLPAVDTAGGRGLWLAHQLTEGLILTRRLDGVTATVTACLEPTISDHTAAPSPLRRGEPNHPRRTTSDG
ncbi:serine/threonine-protein kinase RsbW [Micromonospora sp. A200]|uniref:ATP-binding protein n=1 Tax=Micromonospora sp. A200 TaxID=2940568 RepID=UPI002472FE20|nr:ATP-binding protein [Micromonospora sp. A200]MDH6466293.1 serine/threonine-protein kinase RsbW [Micromonospora sp. A200]